MDFVSGIDGSGTKTGALIMDPVGRVLGAGEGGPSIYGIVPGAVTRASIRNGGGTCASGRGAAARAVRGRVFKPDTLYGSKGL